MTQPWLKQFNNKKVNNMPTQNEVIRVSNSTISYNETTKAIRRIANINSFYIRLNISNAFFCYKKI